MFYFQILILLFLLLNVKSFNIKSDFVIIISVNNVVCCPKILENKVIRYFQCYLYASVNRLTKCYRIEHLLQQLLKCYGKLNCPVCLFYITFRNLCSKTRGHSCTHRGLAHAQLHSLRESTIFRFMCTYSTFPNIFHYKRNTFKILKWYPFLEKTLIIWHRL